MSCEYIRLCEFLSDSDTKLRDEIINVFGEENCIPDMILENFCCGICYSNSSEIDCRIREMFSNLSSSDYESSRGLLHISDEHDITHFPEERLYNTLM